MHLQLRLKLKFPLGEETTTVLDDGVLPELMFYVGDTVIVLDERIAEQIDKWIADNVHGTELPIPRIFEGEYTIGQEHRTHKERGPILCTVQLLPQAALDLQSWRDLLGASVIQALDRAHAGILDCCDRLDARIPKSLSEDDAARVRAHLGALKTHLCRRVAADLGQAAEREHLEIAKIVEEIRIK